MLSGCAIYVFFVLAETQAPSRPDTGSFAAV